MYITNSNDMKVSMDREYNKIKLNIISNQLKDLKIRIDRNLNYIDKDNPITVNRLGEDVIQQLENIIEFITQYIE